MRNETGTQRRRVQFLLATTAALALSSGALAQESTAGSRDPVTIDEIIVTATRQSEALNRVPISVTALTQESLDAQGVKKVDDVMRVVPGVTFRTGTGAGQGGSTIAIRGIASTTGASTTGVYIDDTPIQVRTIGFTAQNPYPILFDLDRVEILRGPQGTLFGAGSQGGTVRFITPKPSVTDTSLYVRGETAFTQSGDPSFELGAAFGTPVVEDRLGLRVSGSYRRDGGWVDRVEFDGRIADENSNWRDAATLRVALGYQPTDNLTITPSVFYQAQKANNFDFYWPSLSDPDDQKFVSKNKISTKYDSYFVLPALNVEWNLGAIDLISNTSYFYRKEYMIAEYTWLISALAGLSPNPTVGVPGLPNYSNGTTFKNAQNVFVQEVRAQSANPDARLTWVAGVFYAWQRQWALEWVNDPQAQWDALMAATTPAARAIYGAHPLVDGMFSYDAINLSHDIQTAFFGDVNFKVTEKLKVTAGLRYSLTDFDFVQTAAGPFNSGSSVGGGEQSEKPLTPKVGVSYQATEDTMFYGTAAKGFRTGGANYATPAACAPFLADFGLTSNPDTYESDTVWSYEVGTKTRLLDRRLSVDVSAYHIDWSNVQQNVGLACGFGFIANMGSATSDGVDLQLRARVTSQLTVDMNVGYNDSKYAETVYGPRTAAGVTPIIVREGVSLGSSPWTVYAAANYDFDLASLPAFVRADVQYAAAQETTTVTDPLSTGYNPNQRIIPSYTLVNLRGGVDFGSWSLTAFANNVTNETALVAQNRPNPRSRNMIMQEATFRPLTIGLQFALRY